MGPLLEWLWEQRSGVAIGLACVLLVITVVLRYGFGLWWPWGIAMATLLALVGLFRGATE